MTKTNMTTMTAMVSLMTMMTMVTMMNDYLVIKCNLVIKCYLNRYEKTTCGDRANHAIVQELKRGDGL